MELPERTLQILHFHEPQLEFGFKQATPHPKDGLFLYGPHGKNRKVRDIRIGVVGTNDGIKFFKAWAADLKKPIEVPPPGKTEKKDRLHLANFPGIAEAFGITFNEDEFATCSLDRKAIEDASLIVNLHEAVKKVVQLYVTRIRKYHENEERAIDVWALVVPELIFERCRPGAKRTGLPTLRGDFGKKQRQRSDLPLLGDLIDHTAEDIFDDAPDFHRQVKAGLLTLTPSQILRETTLAPHEFKNSAGYPIRRLQDRATVAWNLATGLYYKTQPAPPWKLADVRPGVCYVGLVYKNLPNDPNDHVCCAAQMFLSEGDGVVFRGANGPWKTADYEYHLQPPAAKDLIDKVLSTYKDKNGSPPKELFIHGQTSFNDDEWRAFEAAAPRGTNVVGVRIKSTRGETKLFRDGDYPVLRGTAMLLDDRNAYLWTTGYAPQLDTYIGPETPNPLFITVLRSKKEMPAIKTVLADIMGLTKINYNSCNFNDGLPVTVRFANMVGEVLTMRSARDAERQPFKFYI
ncbi:hypothetical protein APY04_2765 [Hyphomicrobium sulfonivorans]|uniref:Piwi domain-containing protein n=1 Tax=Hyphomicrobium sulfonivorans TaxID=121290 RepID=A0A109BBG4_HYPSL|nr:hypothetical protein APY04_2765 [Hyphomicrobium sulfonivorans]